MLYLTIIDNICFVLFTVSYIISGVSVMRINAFRVRFFVLTSVSILVPVLVFDIVLFTSTQNTLKDNASTNIQDTLIANFRNIEAKLSVMDDASTSLQIALAKLPIIVDPDIEVTESELFNATQYPATVHSSLIVDTYSIAGFNHFYRYLPSRSILLVSRMSTCDGINSNVLDCHFIPKNEWGVSMPYLLNWTYSQGNEWYYVIALDAHSVVKAISPIFNMLLLISVCLIVLSFGITLLLAYSTAQPLKDLASAIMEIKNGNFNVKLTEKPNAEFKEIYSGFNEMVHEISALMRDVSEEQNRKTIATIQMLQTENSLVSLCSIAKINHQEEISNLVMALSRFFRIALSGGKHSVPFREAFDLAKQYVTVQNIRLNYKISFTYDIPDSIYDLSVPKFLLQPVIENSILHGFQNKRGEWRINITVNEEGDWITLVMRDNGIGIYDATLERLNPV